jgi:hypothetical protein
MRSKLGRHAFLRFQSRRSGRRQVVSVRGMAKSRGTAWVVSASEHQMAKVLITHPKHWRKRAEGVWRVADQTNDPDSKRKMLRIAQDCEELVRRVELRLKQQQQQQRKSKIQIDALPGAPLRRRRARLRIVAGTDRSGQQPRCEETWRAPSCLNALFATPFRSF